MSSTLFDGPIHVQLIAAGRQARREGLSKTPSDLSAHYGKSGAMRPEHWWCHGWELEDEDQAVKQSEPAFPGQDLWQPVRRREPEQPR